MSTPQTTDTLALNVAERAYEVARAARNAQGAQDLPSWSQVPDLKKLYLTNAARAALDGKEVWDVWSLSCGKEPDDATQVLWKGRPPLLQFLPKLFLHFGRAVSEAANIDHTILSDDGGAEPTIDEVIEEHGIESEKVGEAITKANEEVKAKAKAKPRAAKK
jgi:hypothetical protein